jgi:hypothetical protein
MLLWALSTGTTTYLSCIVYRISAASGSLNTDATFVLRVFRFEFVLTKARYVPDQCKLSFIEALQRACIL